MTKKEIWVLVSVFVVVFLGIGASIFVLVKKTNQMKSRDVAAAVAVYPKEQTQPTNGSVQNPASNDGLTVVAGENTNNPGQLGSGQTAAKNSSSNSSNVTVPGPETFSQYEQYKNGQSGLFGDIVVGTGNEAVAGKKVAVYYKGWLTNGTLFDQTRVGEDGKMQPFVFTLGAREVIPGWEQTVVGMKVGGKRRVIVPPSVGYGSTAQTGIPANSVLVFDVELLAIQ